MAESGASSSGRVPLISIQNPAAASSTAAFNADPSCHHIESKVTVPTTNILTIVFPLTDSNQVSTAGFRGLTILEPMEVGNLAITSYDSRLRA